MFGLKNARAKWELLWTSIFLELKFETASQPRYCQENRHGKCDTESVDSWFRQKSHLFTFSSLLNRQLLRQIVKSTNNERRKEIQQMSVNIRERNNFIVNRLKCRHDLARAAHANCSCTSEQLWQRVVIQRKEEQLSFAWWYFKCAL